MKKIIILLAIILLPNIIYAKEFEIKDINFKVDVADDFYVLTRENLDNNTDLSKIGISKSYMEETMKKNNIYMDILKKDISYEILVVVPDKVLLFDNLNNATDNMIEELKVELVKKTNATNSGIYKTKYNFVMVDYFDKNTGYYIVNYYTVFNSKGYNIQLQKKSAITSIERDYIKNLVDTINIEKISENKNEKNNEEVDNIKSDFNYKNIIIGAIIGIVFGLISYIISLIIKKRKSSN